MHFLRNWHLRDPYRPNELSKLLVGNCRGYRIIVVHVVHRGICRELGQVVMRSLLRRNVLCRPGFVLHLVPDGDLFVYHVDRKLVHQLPFGEKRWIDRNYLLRIVQCRVIFVRWSVVLHILRCGHLQHH